jgi:hypothetical protein
MAIMVAAKIRASRRGAQRAGGECAGVELVLREISQQKIFNSELYPKIVTIVDFVPINTFRTRSLPST